MISTRRLRGSATPSAVGTTGSLLPRPTTMMFSDAMPLRMSPARMTSARWRDSASLTWSVPTASVCPTTRTSGTGPLRDFREHRLDDLPRFCRQLVLAFDEVQREMNRAARLSRERRAEERRDFLGIRRVRLRTRRREPRRGVRLAQHHLPVGLLDDDRGVLAVLLGEQNDRAGLRGTGAEENHQRRRRQRSAELPRTYRKIPASGPRARRPAARPEIVHRRTARGERGHDKAIGPRSPFCDRF